jgi:hypothetical protein
MSPPPGASQSGHERNHLFYNIKGERFIDISGVSGLDHMADGRAVAILDYNRDGWIDLAVVNANKPLLQLFENKIPKLAPSRARRTGYIVLRFVGANNTADPMPGTSPRDGYGAQARITIGKRVLLREYRCGEGFATQNSNMLLVGLGSARSVDKLEVTWPSGETKTRTHIRSGTRITVYEDAKQSPSKSPFHVRAYRLLPPSEDKK